MSDALDGLVKEDVVSSPAFFFARCLVVLFWL